MTMENEPGPSHINERDRNPKEIISQAESNLSSQRVFKKSSPNNKLTMYLASRDLVVSEGRVDTLTGVILVDREFVEERRVYGQITLTFRYGREDEEVMGLKFCNEAVMCLNQLYPPSAIDLPLPTTPLQDALLKRLGPDAYPFTMELTPLAPSSVQLVPAKEYNGAPIGTSYDVRAFVAERFDDKLYKRSTVRMGIRVVQRAFAPPSPYQYVPGRGKTTKEQAKRNRKELLFGCKSAPLDLKFSNVNEKKSRSEETVRTIHHHQNVENWNTPLVHYRNKNINGQHSILNGTTDFQAEESIRDKVKSPLDRQDTLTGETDNEENEEKITDHYHALCGGKRPSVAAYLAELPCPMASVEKPFLLSDGKVALTASLNKAIYSHGEDVRVKVHIKNKSNKTIKRIKVFVVQHVDVCMFSNGKFKNVVAILIDKESCPIHAHGTLEKTYTLLPLHSITKNWIALEDSYSRSSSILASTVCPISNNPEDRNVFAIYVSYYVKVKLVCSVMGGDVSLKLPFTLMHTCSEFEPGSTLTRLQKVDAQIRSRQAKSSADAEQMQQTSQESIKQEKDGT